MRFRSASSRRITRSSGLCYYFKMKREISRRKIGDSTAPWTRKCCILKKKTSTTNRSSSKEKRTKMKSVCGGWAFSRSTRSALFSPPYTFSYSSQILWISFHYVRCVIFLFLYRRKSCLLELLLFASVWFPIFLSRDPMTVRCAHHAGFCIFVIELCTSCLTFSPRRWSSRASFIHCKNK